MGWRWVLGEEWGVLWVEGGCEQRLLGGEVLMR